MKNLLFTGSGVAIVTPMFDDRSINFEKLGELIDFQIENNTDAIIICGTTGESSTMTDREHIECIEFAVKHTSKRIPVIAGTGSNDTYYATELSKESYKLGVDGLLQVTPYYNKCSQYGLIEHFITIADSTDLPIILYNVPTRTGVNINLSTYKVLSEHKNIVATKEASGNISLVSQIKANIGDDLVVYSGNDDQIIPILSLGGLGVISVMANILPKETHDICEYYFNGNTKESLKLQLRLMNIIDALFSDVNPIPVKEALNLMGYEVGMCRLPLCNMCENDKILLINQLNNLNLTH